jgi:hypothetical protein
MTSERILVVSRSLSSSAHYCRYLHSISRDKESRLLPIPVSYSSNYTRYFGFNNIIVIFIEDSEIRISEEFKRFLIERKAKCIFH